MLLRWIAVLSLLESVISTRPRPNILLKRNPSYSPLSESSVNSLANLSTFDSILDFNLPNSFLSRLLVPRLVESKSLIQLQKEITQHFKELKSWHVEIDTFESETPMGLKKFNNLIFTHDIKASRYFTLAAHLDSKYIKGGDFIGAVDSAAPCAMLLDVATSLTPWLNQRKDRIEKEGGEQGGLGQGETLQIIFFDGEEAFGDWTSTDSIYGARHLAEKWSKVTIPPSPTNPIPITPLSRISHLVLLDLLGSANPVIHSWFKNTGWLFDEFLLSEKKLGEAGVLWSSQNGSGTNYESTKNEIFSTMRSFFIDRMNSNYGYHTLGGIEDDHLPFLKAGIPVVHLIASPFPEVWHTLKDDKSALDLDTIKAWALIVRLTVAEYLGLDPAIKEKSKRKEERNSSNSEL